MKTQTATSAKDAAIASAWAAVKQIKTSDPQGLPSKTWAAMPIRTRSVLVMLGGSSMGDPREMARRPWESLSQVDRDGIATCAREMAESLKNASCLF